MIDARNIFEWYVRYDDGLRTEQERGESLSRRVNSGTQRKASFQALGYGTGPRIEVLEKRSLKQSLNTSRAVAFRC